MAVIHYERTDEFWRRGQKYDFLDASRDVTGVEWRVIQPDDNHIWLTEGMEEEFQTFLQMGDMSDKRSEDSEAIFRDFSNGIKTNNDSYVYRFDRNALIGQAQRMIDNYSTEQARWIRFQQPKNLEQFLRIDESTLKWIRQTKRSLLRGTNVQYSSKQIRRSLYISYCQQYYFMNSVFNEDDYQFPSIFPNEASEQANAVICVRTKGNPQPFHVLMAKSIVDLHLTGDSQCFPFYTYDAEGGNRRENISDWALA